MEFGIDTPVPELSRSNSIRIVGVSLMDARWSCLAATQASRIVAALIFL